MFYLDFLKRGVEAGDTVTGAFIEAMLPGMMEAYAEKSAKGGEHSTREKDRREKFEKNYDQSMVSHLLNGIFPTMRLLAWLEMLQSGAVTFTDQEKRIYILAYLMHDIDKIEDLRTLETTTRADIDTAKALIENQLLLCNACEFFPDFSTYLEDITYLVVNTQQKYGTHLHTYLWELQLQERRLLLLRRLCTYSDQIAYLVSSPSAIVLETETLNTILAELSDDELIFAYHQLREVRGLLTNVINNGLVELFRAGRERDVWPYLFFSDGVVYIQRKTSQLTISSEQIVEAVRARLRAICAETIKEHAPGLKFSIQGIVKHPDYYFEFLSLEDYFQVLIDNTLRRTANDVVSGPFEKLRQMQARGELPPDLALADFKEDDERQTGKLSRFLSVIFVTVLGMLDKGQETLRLRVEQAVIAHLALTPYWEQSLSIPNRGGVEYRWFWLAGSYLRDHPGLLVYGEEQSLERLFLSTLRLVLSLAGEELRQRLPQKYLSHLTTYLDSVVELPPRVRSQGQPPEFQRELERYVEAKGKGRRSELACTLCNSAYPTEEQSDSTALFQPWVYKNKLSLYAGKNAGGICTICSLELMLRQIMLRGQLRLTGGKFEALKTKYVAIYPNFFFTAETGELVKGILEQLQHINFFTIRRQLERQDIKVSTLLHLEAFGAPPPVEKTASQPFLYREEDESTAEEPGDDTGEDEDSEQPERKVDESAQRSYIKYVQETYPGMCFFGMKAGKDDDDTSTWAMPAFLALALPLITNTKIVVSEMSLPLFSSGHEFHETVIFDAPHAYLGRLLKAERVRVNQILRKLKVLTSVYTVNLDTYANKGKPEWKHLSDIARDLETDPLFLFSYLRKQERGESMYPGSVEHYMHIYKTILEADLSKIEACVDAYTAFYRGGYKSHSILKPVDIVAKAVINSPLAIEEQDLLWQIQGEMKNWLDRVRNRQATGWAVYSGRDIETKEAEAVETFVRSFYQLVFLNYCQGERGLLRNRINRFKDGCEAYYVYKRGHGGFEEHEEESEAASTL